MSILTVQIKHVFVDGDETMTTVSLQRKSHVAVNTSYALTPLILSTVLRGNFKQTQFADWSNKVQRNNVVLPSFQV